MTLQRPCCSIVTSMFISSFNIIITASQLILKSLHNVRIVEQRSLLLKSLHNVQIAEQRSLFMESDKNRDILVHAGFSVTTGFQAPLHKKLGLKLGLFSQKFRAFVNEK